MVPIEATLFEFKFNIWKKKSAIDDFPFVPVTATNFLGFLSKIL